MDVYQDATPYLLPGQVAVEASYEDVFEEETAGSGLLLSHQTESLDSPDIPLMCGPVELLERRLLVLRGILESEGVFLNELETLLTPMKALRASAGTSQPVLSAQQVQTVFFQVPELRDMHRQFYADLRDLLGPYGDPEPGPGAGAGPNPDPQDKDPPRSIPSNDLEREWSSETHHGGLDLTVGDLFLKMVSQFGVYRGFIENYESAVDVVRRCSHSDERFRTLAQSMMANSGSDKARTKYSFEALLYKPLDRVTKTTLVLHDLLNWTPKGHRDHALLQEALRLSRSFLSGVNESSHCRREVTLSHGMRRKLMRDGFVVDACEGERHLRHLFLYTDLLLCTKLKPGARGKQAQYRFCWYTPLSRVKLRWRTEEHEHADVHARTHTHTIRTKMFQLRQQQQRTGESKGSSVRCRKKLEQIKMMLLTHTHVHRLELHSLCGKSRSVLLSSLFELEEWREAICKLSTDNVETLPPDLLTLTSACAKLRMTQQPPLHSMDDNMADSLCGTLSVAVHSACGLRCPAYAYVCVEVDGVGLYENQARSHSCLPSLSPQWEQEFWFQVEGARTLRLLCVSEADAGRSEDDSVLGKASVKLDGTSLQKKTRRTLPLGPIQLTLSLMFHPHPLGAPSLAPGGPRAVFGIPIGTAARQEGVLVPHVVRCCVEEVERRGMEEVGIYRVSGAACDIGSLKKAFDSDLREAVSRIRRAEVNTVSGVLKLYFRELPEPLVPAELFQSLVSVLDMDMNSRLASMLSLLQSCPDANRSTFLYFLHHLQRVSLRQEVNKMSLINLATVFGPSLLRAPVQHCGPTLDISQEVVVQVQVLFHYLLCDGLPPAQTSLPYDTDLEEETTRF